MIKPIPGDYHDDYMNSLLRNGTTLEPLLTDSGGYVTFTGMHFSVHGAYGEFKIIFRCEGVSAESHAIVVTTSVLKV